MNFISFSRPSIEEELKQRLKNFKPQGEIVTVNIELPQVVSLVLPPGLSGFRYFAQPDKGFYALGLGETLKFTCNGKNRFSILKEYFYNLSNKWEVVGDNNIPFAFCGFGFFEYSKCNIPNIELVIPEILFQNKNDLSFISFSANSNNIKIEEWLKKLDELFAKIRNISINKEINKLNIINTHPDYQTWITNINSIMSSINDNKIKKIVLSRFVETEGSKEFDYYLLVSYLSSRHSNCTIFAFDLGDTLLAGATPELLARLSNGNIDADALAGTQSESKSSLLDDPKERREHSIVVEQILESLFPIATNIRFPAIPELRQLKSMQHLWTGIKAQAKPGINIIDIVSAMHPTPAVGGTPTSKALDILKLLQENRLGWYSGGIGFINPNGEGEFAVVLRCAGINGNKAFLSAGAGIVEGSDPELEWQETNLKLNTMIEALEEA